jgi:hypothetical protein
MTEQILIPVIKALPRLDFPGGMMFWCPFCKRWHYHGIGDGHRYAHCSVDGPLREHGYILKMMNKAELREIRKAIDLYLGDDNL